MRLAADKCAPRMRATSALKSRNKLEVIGQGLDLASKRADNGNGG
eukprot:CAMPEP_0195112232 /NCGR_PEP_ID=MMETSP0448-20130528/98559_1 /TAXON_ID=66468 /ORGANISM="Heterocapsa triquestra, Strain CCMP 448" /LENGTH=44 /DNA_ID= /DNA_START= /DNA_END= /DNA_ORIENTATION=